MVSGFSGLCRCLWLVLAFIVLGGGASFAETEVNTREDRLALNGTDVVAYFTRGEAVTGEDKLEVTHAGARYHFASNDHKQMFEADPERYLPRFGGFCSYGVVLGKKFDTDPSVFKIVDGNLYLQLDLGTQKVWARDQDRNIAIAERIWPVIKSMSPADLND